MKNHIFAIALALGLTAPVAGAQGEQFVFEFKYDRTELVTAGGRAQLLNRLDTELRDVCTVEPKNSFAQREMLDRRCVKITKARTLDEILRKQETILAFAG